MGRTRFENDPCPIARATDLIGDKWTLVVLREAFRGRRRFDAFQQALSLSRSVLTQRLGRLVEAGLLEKRLYEERPPRHEYVLTDKGRDFYPVLAALWRWGSDWLWAPDDQTPLELYDKQRKTAIRPQVVDEHTGEPIDVRQIRIGRRRDL